MPRLGHLECVEQVALSRPLVVGLGEALGGDQLVLELGGVAVTQRVPDCGSVRRPDPERAPGRLRGGLELRRKRRRALEVDRDHRLAAADLLGQDPQQAGGLAGAAGAQDQAVGRELTVGHRHLSPAAVGAQHDRLPRRRRARGREPASHVAAEAERGQGDRESQKRRHRPGHGSPHHRDERDQHAELAPVGWRHRAASARACGRARSAARLAGAPAAGPVERAHWT